MVPSIFNTFTTIFQLHIPLGWSPPNQVLEDGRVLAALGKRFQARWILSILFVVGSCWLQFCSDFDMRSVQTLYVVQFQCISRNTVYKSKTIRFESLMALNSLNMTFGSLWVHWTADPYHSPIVLSGERAINASGKGMFDAEIGDSYALM